MTLSKIEKLYGVFKNLCENSIISYVEYSAIFDGSETSFNIWDTDANGLIDTLELFVGIALYSEARLEDKIKCKIINLE